MKSNIAKWLGYTVLLLAAGVAFFCTAECLAEYVDIIRYYGTSAAMGGGFHWLWDIVFTAAAQIFVAARLLKTDPLAAKSSGRRVKTAAKIAAAALLACAVIPKLPTAANAMLENAKVVSAAVTCYTFVLIFLEEIKSKKAFLKRLIFFVPVVFSTLFTVFVYIPIDTYCASYKEYSFTADILLSAIIGCFLYVFAAFAAVMLLLDKKALKNTAVFLSALNVCVYLQYMFMNKNLGVLDGTQPDWDAHTGFGIFNAAVWITAAVLSFVIYYKTDKGKNAVIFGLPLLLLALQLFGAAALIATAPKTVWYMEAVGTSGKDQYKVAAEKNIIFFVLDAFDNSQLEDAEKACPGIMDKFGDFTVYKNTCSVYDSTPTSMTQMFTGMDFDNTLAAADYYNKAWYGERAEEFFSRLHKAGYTVNFYNMSGSNSLRYKGKIDNLYVYDKEKQQQIKKTFRKENISFFFNVVSAYRSAPFLLKRFVDVNGFNREQLKNAEGEQNADYENDVFETNLRLETAEGMKKAFIMQHLDGTHGNDTPEHCLDLMLEYISQLKELGLYDDSCIVITADHGKHRGAGYIASTPIFMVKRANETHIKPIFSNAPVYHTDIQATVLGFAGLYDPQKDTALFGTDIYAWKDGDKRERSWYVRVYDPGCPPVPYNNSTKLFIASGGANAYYRYVYIGDTDDLAKAVNDKKYEVFPMKEYFG